MEIFQQGFCVMDLWGFERGFRCFEIPWSMTEGMACDEGQGVRQRGRRGDAEQQVWQ